MELEKPNYYAIIPANVRYDTRLKPNEKLLYGEITCLANMNGHCYANNSYFAQLYSVSIETVSRWISKLVSLGYLKSEIIYKENSKEFDKRFLSIETSIPLDKKINTPRQKDQEGYRRKDQGGIDKKIKDNNTSINNTRMNNKKIYKKSFQTVSNSDLDLCNSIIDHLNNNTGSRFKCVGKNQKLILDRLAEGFTFDDFVNAINTKVVEWKNTEFSKYLRPETLFGSKLASYSGSVLSTVDEAIANKTITNNEAKNLNAIKGFLEDIGGDYA